MQKITISLLALFVLSVFHLHAQTEVEIKANEELYFWGEGTGATQREAKENSLHDLSSKISLHVSSVDKQYLSNEINSKDVNSYVCFERKMQTYSDVTLIDCHSRLISAKKPYKFFTYIEKKNVDKMFEDRLKIMQANVQIANDAYRDLNIADALRYYYTSYLYTQTLRYRSDAIVTDEDGKEQMAIVWLRKRIEDILSNVKVSIIGKCDDDENRYSLAFFYKKQPVQKIAYTYWDGNEFRERISYAQDGRGVVELEPSYSVKDVKVLIEYKFLELVNKNNSELTSVYDILAEDVNFCGQCGVNVKLSNIGDNTSVYEGLPLDSITKKQSSAIDELSNQRLESKILDKGLVEKYSAVLDTVVRAIKLRKYETAMPMCTKDGSKAFTELISYGRARIVDTPLISFTEYNNHIYARSVPMEFSFKGNNKFIENVVFTLTKEGLIDNISFGLSFKAEKDLYDNMKEKSYETARAAINNFLENYKTAYALGRFDYLNMIFSDNALIVTGKEVYRMVGNDEVGYHSEKMVVKTHQSKQQYLTNLKRAFDSKEFVNIQFVNNYIQPSRRSIDNGRHVYGIQIRQDYFSNNYKDQGYLFLRVDVTEPDKPIVSVRVWQEMPDEEEGIVNLANWQNFFEQ